MSQTHIRNSIAIIQRGTLHTASKRISPSSLNPSHAEFGALPPSSPPPPARNNLKSVSNSNRPRFVGNSRVESLKNIALHREAWLDFPVHDEEDYDDFDLTDAQQEHALAVERLAPTLAALRMGLCPEYMSENCFWKIYFGLLQPWLNKNDAELLSTPQIVEAGAMLAHDMQSRAKTKPEPVNSDIATSDANKSVGGVTSYLSETVELPEKGSHIVPSPVPSESMPLETSASDADLSVVTIDFETEKHPLQTNEMQVVGKSVVKEEAMDSTKHQHSLSSCSIAAKEKFEDDGDNWLKEESLEMVGMTGSTMQLGNDEDVSFSDLEDGDVKVPGSYKKTMSGSDSSTKDSRDWVQVSRNSADSVKDIHPDGVKATASQQVNARSPETKESNDWLDVDDTDEM
ncbi:putative BSD domain-containing protein [Melia azedarach]|uniref:BSD domain-containing protein n=1 Tax=Melia azedarach TaxID=155640 RepID=A0ACC1XP43_MELAZ|nr:putative BSD domain-containing protein [Melia azedarach]